METGPILPTTPTPYSIHHQRPPPLVGIARHHIESYNYLVDVEMKKIVEHNSLVLSDSNPNIYLRYTNIYVEPPTIEQDMVISKVH